MPRDNKQGRKHDDCVEKVKRGGHARNAYAVCNANPGVKDECHTYFECDDRLDDNVCRRGRPWILDEGPYLARQLLVFKPGNLPRGCLM